MIHKQTPTMNTGQLTLRGDGAYSCGADGGLSFEVGYTPDVSAIVFRSEIVEPENQQCKYEIWRPHHRVQPHHPEDPLPSGLIWLTEEEP